MKRNPHDARLVARGLSHPNREVEDTAIRRVDEAVFDKVRQVENNAVERAHRFMDAGRKSITDASELANEIEQLRAAIAKRNGPMDPATAEQWEILRNKARAAQKALNRHVAEAEFQAVTLEDPYAAYVRLTDKFTVLRPEFDF